MSMVTVDPFSIENGPNKLFYEIFDDKFMRYFLKECHHVISNRLEEKRKKHPLVVSFCT